MKLNVLAQYKFKPLHNADGTPCYFRVSCLALFACSLLLHVALKPSPADSDLKGAATEYIALEQSLDHHNNALVSGELNALPHVATNATQGSIHNGGSLEQDDSWSLFSFEDDKPNKVLFSNRKQALSEMLDGASFLASCGNINSSYNDCKFDFSSKVAPYYDASVVAAKDAFKITLVAKGEQIQDECTKFVVGSDGIYKAFDQQGRENLKCFLNTAINDKVLAIRTTIDKVNAGQSTLAVSN